MDQDFVVLQSSVNILEQQLDVRTVIRMLYQGDPIPHAFFPSALLLQQPCSQMGFRPLQGNKLTCTMTCILPAQVWKRQWLRLHGHSHQ